MPLPHFAISGERRSGTTSLVKWLSAHPDIYMPSKTDIGFFLDDGVQGREWIDGEVDETAWEGAHSLDELLALFAEAGKGSTVGFKCADHLFWRPAHARLMRYVPEIKHIITLRHPIERAWSHYWNEVGKGREQLTFEEALQAENDRMRTSAYARDHLSYRARGYYDESLASFFESVPRDNVLVLTLEESQRDPVKAVRRIYTFIGVDPDKGLEEAGQRYNANWTTVSRTKVPVLAKGEEKVVHLMRSVMRRMANDPVKARAWSRRVESIFRKNKDEMVMPPPTWKMLAEAYRPSIDKLEVLLDRTFAHWEL